MRCDSGLLISGRALCLPLRGSSTLANSSSVVMRLAPARLIACGTHFTGRTLKGDFALPERTLAVFCYHVGQLDDTEARDPQYQGRGIGLRLLDHFLEWAKRENFDAVVAKAVPSPRPIMAFMGGQPAKAYQARGFAVVASWVDTELKAVATDKGIIPNDVSPDDAARVSCVVRRLR